VFEGGEQVRVSVSALAKERMERPILGFIVRDRLGQDLFGENTLQRDSAAPCPVDAGEEIIGEFVFDLPMLPNGEYAMMASIADGEQYDNVQHHYVHDGLILTVSSAQVRFGLVGVPIQSISLYAKKPQEATDSEESQ
jgi:lipopolysaccharide transport system ATP-binding protein